MTFLGIQLTAKAGPVGSRWSSRTPKALGTAEDLRPRISVDISHTVTNKEEWPDFMLEDEDHPSYLPCSKRVGGGAGGRGPGEGLVRRVLRRLLGALVTWGRSFEFLPHCGHYIPDHGANGSRLCHCVWHARDSAAGVTQRALLMTRQRGGV